MCMHTLCTHTLPLAHTSEGVVRYLQVCTFVAMCTRVYACASQELLQSESATDDTGAQTHTPTNTDADATHLCNSSVITSVIANRIGFGAFTRTLTQMCAHDVSSEPVLQGMYTHTHV